jgi:hypothetical protein
VNIQDFIETCKKCPRRSKCHVIGCILDEEPIKSKRNDNKLEEALGHKPKEEVK